MRKTCRAAQQDEVLAQVAMGTCLHTQYTKARKGKNGRKIARLEWANMRHLEDTNAHARVPHRCIWVSCTAVTKSRSRSTRRA
jgi:hypothetical protein